MSKCVNDHPHIKQSCSKCWFNGLWVTPFHEVRQRPEALECWRHLSISGWHEVCRACTKACKQKIILELNDPILLQLRHEWHTTISVWARRNLTRGRWLKMAQMLTLKRNYNLRQPSKRSYDVRVFEFIFLPTFESGFRCSRNSGPPEVWIISLYLWYDVYFAIIIVQCLVTVLSLTYLKHVFWGWTVPVKTEI